MEHKERGKLDFISSVRLINTTKTICELINKSDNTMWGFVTTEITVNQMSRMLLGELFTSRIGVFGFKPQFLWLLRIYFHQLNYLQLTDKRPPHVSFILFFHRFSSSLPVPARKNVNEFETSSQSKECSFQAWRMYHALSRRYQFLHSTMEWFLYFSTNLMMDIIKSNREKWKNNIEVQLYAEELKIT